MISWTAYKLPRGNIGDLSASTENRRTYIVDRDKPRISQTFTPFVNHVSDLELELLPVSKETLDILLWTTWHVGSVLKVLTKLKSIYSFAGEQSLNGGAWIYLTRGDYWTFGGGWRWSLLQWPEGPSTWSLVWCIVLIIFLVDYADRKIKKNKISFQRHNECWFWQIRWF